jgi:hypothetical protein
MIDLDQTAFDGGCHCGTIRFRVVLAAGLRTARRCTCSFCRMRGAVAVTARVGDFEILSGQDALATYEFNTHVAKHHFCSRCGIYTHHRRRSNPGELGVNAACLDGVSPFDFASVPVTDGIHHPSDGNSNGVVGVLAYVTRDVRPLAGRQPQSAGVDG